MSDGSSKTEIGGGGALFSPMLEAAVRLAARGHYHQFRKHSAEDESGSPSGDFLPDRIPYIAHLMGTMCILARVGVRDEVLAAAILHDYLEDVPDPDGRESIRVALGDEVLSLVLEVTEHKRRDVDESDTWLIRKREQLEHIEQMPEEAVLIKAADVLHNMLALLADLEAAEDTASVWQPFNAGPERQLWYFSSVVDAVDKRLGDHPLVDDLQQAINRLKLFVTE
jgi:(p)ppGpp synthase/HD superfamily hydrolase